MYPFRKIMVAMDFDSASRGALDLGTGLAREYEAELVIVHAVEMLVPPYPIALMPELPVIQQAAQSGLERIIRRVEAVWPRVRGTVLWGSPAEVIVRYAEEIGVDLVVVGTHGRKGPSRWLLRSVAEKVTRWSRSPVLTVHEGDDQSRGHRAELDEDEVRPPPT
jgi:nucleotide-binding universal stress UspA family protein